MQTHKNSLNLALGLTISRFFLVPVFLYYFLIGDFKTALWVLIIASITDVTDGFLARKLGMGTDLGTVLDPLADKFLMITSFIVLTAKGVLPWWLCLIVLGRDFYIVIGMIYVYYVRKIQVEIKPTRLSKYTTFAQFTLLVVSFIKAYLLTLNHDPSELDRNILESLLNYFHASLILMVPCMTIITFFQYTKVGLKWLKGNKSYAE